jgi:hypothetical protein
VTQLSSPPAPQMARIAAQFPDPMLSVNVYCSGLLSNVIHRAVAPAVRQLRKLDQDGKTYLWLMRYAKCGEHLKIRVHGPESWREAVRELLGMEIARYFDGLGPPDPSTAVKTHDFATPIDQEDRVLASYPDRSCLWTVYNRSHVSMGFRPYLDDDVYVGLLTRCLARGTDILLGSLATDDQGQVPHSQLQQILLLALVSGLSSVPLAPRDKALYLLYHRNWIVRSALKWSAARGGPGKAEQILERFRGESEKVRPAVSRLGQLARRAWAGEPMAWDEEQDSWRVSMADLAEYAAPICGDLAHAIDPFADRPLYPPLFKAFHGFANQMGLSRLDEAFAHHLLLSVVAPEENWGRSVPLKPVLAKSETGAEVWLS